jgi:hypothetical protein
MTTPPESRRTRRPEPIRVERFDAKGVAHRILDKPLGDVFLTTEAAIKAIRDSKIEGEFRVVKVVVDFIAVRKKVVESWEVNVGGRRVEASEPLLNWQEMPGNFLMAHSAKNDPDGRPCEYFIDEKNSRALHRLHGDAIGDDLFFAHISDAKAAAEAHESQVIASLAGEPEPAPAQ